jgi:Domain of unknown function (DUF1844)
MTGEGKSFTIKDRRLFTADGELRPDDEQESSETPAESPAASSPAAAAPSPETARQAPAAEPPGEVDFAGFIMSLGAQAFEALSAEPPALAAVRTLVAILEMLRAKTEGRRTPEEDGVLETLLYQLRLGYVERSKTGRA